MCSGVDFIYFGYKHVSLCLNKIDWSSRNKGVKVELGIPYELWDEPSAEVSIMQRNVGLKVQGQTTTSKLVTCYH